MSVKLVMHTTDVIETRTYEYLAFNLEDVTKYLESLRPQFKDSYLSEDILAPWDAIKLALAQGFRWVRTDEDSAIFEKTTIRVFPRV